MRAEYLFAFFLLCTLQISIAIDKYLIDFPEAHTNHNRLFIQVLHYDLHHIDPLMLNINEFLSMCEGGWSPTVVIFTCANYTSTILRYITEKSYCYRTKSYMKIIIRRYDKDVGNWLAAPHRLIALENINDFDFFVYMEDDMIFRYTLLTAFLNATKELQLVLPENGLENYSIGYQRFRKHHHEKSSSLNGETVIEEHVEELPHFDFECFNDQPYVVCHEEEAGVHQALWTLTRAQLLTLHDRCNYLKSFTGGRYVLCWVIQYGYRCEDIHT